jgi:hypothetical protein
VLLDAHAAAYDRYLRYQMIAVVFRGEIAAREHQALLETALARDWKRAQAIMVSHIRGCVEHALREDNAGLFGRATESQQRTLAAKERSDTRASGLKRKARAATSTLRKAKT